MERKSWNRSHPAGFEAHPSRNSDGTLNLMVWQCAVPGRKCTPLEACQYKLKIFFPVDYPEEPPVCKFVPALLHPNIFPSGIVCHSILWHPDMTLEQILAATQDLLHNPDRDHPFRSDAYKLLERSQQEYDEVIRFQALNITD
ncbi:hypothetical protein KR067_009749, partial [Drosophila pandora]